MFAFVSLNQILDFLIFHFQIIIIHALINGFIKFEKIISKIIKLFKA
jgi:hypothetical protein